MNYVEMKKPTPTLQSRVALGSFAGPFATGRLRGCAGARCCRPAREIAFLQPEEKKHKEKPTSESNTERRSSRGVEAMPELVFHIRKPSQMYWNVALSSAWRKVAGLTRQESWGDQFGAILFQDQKLKRKPLFRVEGRTQVSLLTEKDLSLGGS